MFPCISIQLLPRSCVEPRVIKYHHWVHVCVFCNIPAVIFYCLVSSAPHHRPATRIRGAHQHNDRAKSDINIDFRRRAERNYSVLSHQCLYSDEQSDFHTVGCVKIRYCTMNVSIQLQNTGYDCGSETFDRMRQYWFIDYMKNIPLNLFDWASLSFCHLFICIYNMIIHTVSSHQHVYNATLILSSNLYFFFFPTLLRLVSSTFYVVLLPIDVNFLSDKPVWIKTSNDVKCYQFVCSIVCELWPANTWNFHLITALSKTNKKTTKTSPVNLSLLVKFK